MVRRVVVTSGTADVGPAAAPAVSLVIDPRTRRGRNRDTTVPAAASGKAK